MKKCTRFLAWVMTLVMIFSCYCGTTVFAVDTDTDTTADSCNGHTGWQALTTATIGSYMTLSGGHYYLNEGSYYLAETLNMGVTIYVWPGATVNLCLNGYDITMTNSNRTILNPKNSATLNLYDCGTQVRYYDANGWVDEPTGGWTDENATAYVANGAVKIVGGAIYGASSFDKGGAGVFIQNYATFNMYGGNILGCSCSTTGHWGGGVYNYEGTFNMYSGVIAYNSSSSYAGGLFIRSGSTVNMYGGEIAYNYAPTSGAGVYSGGEFTMSGDASIHDNFGSYQASGFYNFGGGTLIMTENSSIYNNISGDGGSAGVYSPSYNSVMSMSGTSSITGNITTGISAGVGLVAGVMTISDYAEVSGNYVVDSVTIGDLTTTNADGIESTATTRNGIALKTVSAIGDKVVASNVYLSNGKTITFDGFYGNDVYVTAAAGLGLVATGATDNDGNLSSDVTSYYAVRVDETTIHLTEAHTLDGDTASKTYADGDIDLSKLGMFEILTDDTEYTITGGTGVGTIDGEDLTVSSIGTFIIEAYTPHSPTNPPTWQTSTLTVTAKTVDVAGITTIGSIVGDVVELNNTSGTIDGDVNDDNVSIDFSVAYGEITDTTYTDGDTGEFDVTIHGISLTGEDAGNYTLESVNGDSTAKVTISEIIPHVSWPTAVDLVYGDTRSNDDLMGGIAVVQTNGTTTTYTTVTGKFEWVSEEIEDAGTHTYEVKFVVTGTYDSEITAAVEALQDLRHNVTQVVQAAEVSFTIGDSIIDDANDVVDDLNVSATYDDDGTTTTLAVKYYELWYYDVDSSSWSTTAPTADTLNDSGSYLLGASLTSNYRHAGTQESTAKQIGAFVIGSSATTYGVTFGGYGSNTVSNITGALPQTIHILPTLTGAYTGWKHENGTIYDFGSRFAQPEGNVTFTAVAAAANATLSGTVTGTNLKGDEDAELEGVVVTLMQGAEQVAVYTTASDGKYEFDVPQGRYNLVVTRDQVIRNEITLYVNLNNNTVMPTISIPDIRQNTIFNVASGMTGITIDGMDKLIDTKTVSYKVELNPSSDTAAILAKAAEKALTADNAKLYIDLSIQKRADDAAGYSEITSLGASELLTFYIPLAGVYQGHDSYSVYRYDGSAVDILTNLANADGEYMTISEDKDLLTLVVQKSAVYGLVFEDIETEVYATAVDPVTYTTEPISTDAMFETILETSDGARTYIITGGTGEGTIDENGNVTVTKVGTFEITVKVAATVSSTDDYYSTATLSVAPKPVTISGITCVDQEVSDITNSQVTLNTGAFLTGVETGDSVRIDYSSAVGTITNDDYANDDTLTTTGINTFAVTVTGLVLTGDDAGNYKITTDPAISSQVTINMSLVYIAWPAAHDIIYGQTQSDENLYGGKVVVYSNGTYTDITDDGEFKWVTLEDDNWDDGTDNDFAGTTSNAATDAGTYTYDVKFVENTGTSGSYSDALENATQMVTQVVQPAAVTFTIEDSTVSTFSDLRITAEDEHENTLTEIDDYKLQYADASATTITATYDEPTESGTYYLYAEFTTSNYRHAGTQESTGKQIGAFTIGTVSSTYGVTFMVGDSADDSLAITDALPQSIHILPTLDETLYTGWKHQDGTTYAFGERFPQPEENVTFTAIAAPVKSATISGTVTGTDLNGDEDTEISRVGVALYQGSTLVDYTTTSAEDATLGQYSFSVVPGMYNLVITYDLDITTEITYFVDTTNDSVVKDVALPDVIQNTVLEVATGLPDMLVNNLDSLLDTSQDSEVKLEITSNTDADADIVTQIVNIAAEAGIGAGEIKQFFNIDLSARTGEDASFTALADTGDELLTFYIPLTGTYQGHDDYIVYRYHDGEVQTLTKEVNDDGESIAVSDTNLIINAKFFSLYGIAFANGTNDTTTTTGSSGSSSITYYTSTVATGDDGSVGVSPARASRGTKVTITPVPDDGYQVDTITVTDSAGNSYTVTDSGNGTYTFTQPSVGVTITVTFVTVEDEEIVASALPFTDVSVDDWFYEDVLYLYNLGLMSGTTATTFEPYGGNSRAMVAQMMYNLEGQPERTEFDFFSDVVEGQWYEPAINWCASQGVVDGYLDGLYRPDTIISRQEFTSVLYDHCLHLGYDLSALDDLSAFVDSPSPWATTYVMWAVEAELIQGDTSGYLNCTDQLTRCEAAAVFARFLRNVYEA